MTDVNQASYSETEGEPGGELKLIIPKNGTVSRQSSHVPQPDVESVDSQGNRPEWGRSIQFLMSCLSLSVGLGNIWRFPFTCYENGGAIFVIPYLIILFFVGKPYYFLEMILGQFTSKGSMKALEAIPMMKGIGWGQQFCSAIITTYYTSIIGLCLSYVYTSFTDKLPWYDCTPFSDPCYPAYSSSPKAENDTSNEQSSSQLYFIQKMLQAKSLNDGIGSIVPHLAVTLLISWILIYLVIIKGIKSSGKLSYVFAIFPYFFLIVLLIFACQLPGAGNGILYFLNPFRPLNPNKPELGQAWEQLFNPKVWYDACTQCFYSLTIGMGCIIMFSSYNKFNHNIYRDASIVSFMDTGTSMLGGVIIFAILGNLSHNLKTPIGELVKSPLGIAFIIYPEVIVKSQNLFAYDWAKYIPSTLSVVFFGMLFTLGVGSTVGLMNNMLTNLKDFFPKVKTWQFSGVCCTLGFLIGLVYVTESGINVLDFVDFFGGQFLVFMLATAELIAIVWIYGLQNICWDVEFMLNRKLSMYWRICWAVVMPAFMLSICASLPKFLILPEDLPTLATICGWTIFLIGFLQVFVACGFIYGKKFLSKNVENHATKAKSFGRYLVDLNTEWGPANKDTKIQWLQFKKDKRNNMENLCRGLTWYEQKWGVLTGKF